jgi:cation diffusion facilitator family transporter
MAVTRQPGIEVGRTIGDAVVSGSEAILLDGLFSALGFFMALMTLYVARLVSRPDDEVFQYGYAHFVPLVNVVKSLVMAILCGFALLSAISTLLSGGQTMAIGNAMFYALLATLIGTGLYLYLGKMARQSASILVALDAKAARMDMLLSGAVLVSFVLGWLSLGTSMERFIDYLDPSVVAVLCLVALPVPLKVLWQNGREVLLLAPDPVLQQSVIGRIESVLANFPIEDHRIRMLKMGNVMAVTLHLRPSEQYELRSVDDLDRVRHSLEQALEALEFEIGLDVMFVNDMSLAR